MHETVSLSTLTGGQGMTHCEAVLDKFPQLFRLCIAGVFDLDGASLLDDLLSGKWSLGVSPSRVGPPLLDGFDVLQVFSFFLVNVAHGGCVDEVG